MSSTEAGPPPTVGGGRYTLGDLIGRGGAAEVFRARDELLGRDVAVKLFPAGVGEADDSRQRREVQTLAGMNHPGLVTIYDVGQDNSRAYFVMQLIEGESLAERLRGGPLELGDVVALGAALADALTYVHRHGVVHRDIKPGNVLLDAEGRPHLSDFGIAVLADATNITATGMVIGTASYLSPEQVRGQPVGPASDVYALGLVLLECVTARREYPGNALEAAVARLHRAPDVPSDLPGPLFALLTAMTGDEPAERPTTEQVVGELRMLAREAGMDASTVLAPAPVTGTGSMRTTAMGGPGTGPTAYAPAASPPYGPTQRMNTPPGGGYGPPPGPDRTALVGAGPPGGPSSGPPTAQGAPGPARRGRRGVIVAVVLALLVLGGAIAAYSLFSGGNTPAPAAPAPAPSLAPTTTTTSQEATTTRRRTSVAPAPSTTSLAPPPQTSQAPPSSDRPSPTTSSRDDGNGNDGGNDQGGNNNGNNNGGNNNGGNNGGATSGNQTPDLGDLFPG